MKETMPSTLHAILPGLFCRPSRLRSPQHPVNSYLWIAEPGKTILIDPAADLTPAEVSAAGLPPVTAIYITHLQAENAAGPRRKL